MILNQLLSSTGRVVSYKKLKDLAFEVHCLELGFLILILTFRSKIQMIYFESQVSNVELQMSNFKLFVGDNPTCATQHLAKTKLQPVIRNITFQIWWDFLTLLDGVPDVVGIS